MNATREPERPAGLPRRRAREKFHPRRGAARRFAVGAESYGAQPGDAPGIEAADSHHAQRFSDRGGGTSAHRGRTTFRADRYRAACVERTARSRPGTIRITAGLHATETILRPKLVEFL